MLLDQAGYRARRKLQAIGHDEPASTCVTLGVEIGASEARSAMLIMGDGSARRTLKAPGYLDPRAAAFDAEVENAVRAGELDALLRLDRQLARDLMATGLPAWQVLSGAMRSLRLRTEVLYCDPPSKSPTSSLTCAPEGLGATQWVIAEQPEERQRDRSARRAEPAVRNSRPSSIGPGGGAALMILGQASASRQTSMRELAIARGLAAFGVAAAESPRWPTRTAAGTRS